MAFAKRASHTNLGSPGILKQLTQRTGVPLPRELLAAAENLLGTELSEVMVHTSSIADQAAAAIGANAFAIGPNLFFRSGKYDPHTLSGQQLLMHELTHAAQWIRGDIAPDTKSEGFQVAAAGHPFEHEADSNAALVRPGFNWASSSKNTSEPSPKTTHNELPLGGQALPRSPAPILGGFVLRDDNGGICIGAPTEVPAGGTEVNRPGRINWADDPKVRLRGSDSTSDDNIIGELDYNTRVQVIKEMPGSWYFVSTETGTLGYIYKEYVWTNLPEPNAQLHKVEEGDAGTAIAIAERYYGDQANDWGQDLRFYVNVLAWANGVEVPNTTDGWRDVRFQAGENRWIPSAQFARSLVGVVNSGSYSYNTMDAIGLADVVERMGELWDDFAKAISLAGQYIPEALADGFFEGIRSALMALAEMLLISAVILAVSTAVGASIGALAGGAAAAPGAAAGFELGMLLLEWMGMAFLIAWIGDALIGVGSAFGGFLAGVWNARGNEAALDAAAQELAQGLGLLLKTLVEAIILFGVGKGLGYAVGKLKSTRFGEALGETALARWLGDRMGSRSDSGGEHDSQLGGYRDRILRQVEAPPGESIATEAKPGTREAQQVADKFAHGGDAIEMLHGEAPQILAQLKRDGAYVSSTTQISLNGDVVYRVKLKNGQTVTMLSREVMPVHNPRGVSRGQVKLARERAKQARVLNQQRSAAAEAAIAGLPRRIDDSGEVHVIHPFDRVVAGGGYSATTNVGTLGNPNLMKPGEVPSGVPATVAFTAGPEPWAGRAKSGVSVGQPHNEISTTGSLQPKHFSEVDQGFLEARALTDAMDLARAEAGMVTVSGHRVVRVQERSNPGKAPWMVEGANVRLTVETANGTVFYYANKADLTVGPGVARKLEPRMYVDATPGKSLSKAEQALADSRAALLEGDGRVLSGEQAVANPPAGGKTLVSGGGPTGNWAAEQSMSDEIVWIGRIDPGKGDGPVLSPTVSTRVRATVAEVEKRLAAGHLSANERAYYQRFRDRMYSHGQSMLPRNLGPEGAFAKKSVRIESGVQIRKVTPMEEVKPGDVPEHLRSYAGQAGKVLVEFDGMAADVFDHVVISHGAESSSPGGIASVTEGLQFKLDIVDGTLASLHTSSGNIRVLGSSIWDRRFTRRPKEPGEVGRLVKKDDYNILKTLHKKFGEQLPLHSRGINVSLNANAQTIGLANRTREPSNGKK